jgi:hypothetical protein
MVSLDANSITAAAVLRLIRDEKVSYRDLQDRFAAVGGERNHKLHAIVWDLHEVGALEQPPKDNGPLTVTEHWMALQNLLNLRLEADGNNAVVRPFFGAPTNYWPRHGIDIFVVMPFLPVMKPVYEDHIHKVAIEKQLEVQRADDMFGVRHNIMEYVWSGICAAKVIVADCTGRNANVFYEIGIAHTVGKPVILITQNPEDVPFDLQAIRYLHYEYTPRGMALFEQNLAKTIDDLRLVGESPKW